jgi:hypothetical protein
VRASGLGAASARVGPAALLLPDFVGAETTRPRLVAARVTALEFIPRAGSRNQ